MTAAELNDARPAAPSDPTVRREALKKLAVGGAIVWAAPVLSGAFSAAAAVSPCTPRLLDWDAYTTTAPFTTFSSAVVGGTTVTLSTSFSGGTVPLATNRRIIAGPQGGVAQNALRFEQTPVQNGLQLITFGFSVPVTNVSLSIFDIDNQQDSWSDRIRIVTTGFAFSVPTGSDVIGLGVTGNRFRSSQDNINYDNTSNRGNLVMSWAGPVSSISFEFACSNERGGENQLINVSDISFCA